MEIDDIEYVLRGIESKLGATAPVCLLQPILAAATSSAPMAPPSPPLETRQPFEVGDSMPAPVGSADASCSTPRARGVPVAQGDEVSAPSSPGESNAMPGGGDEPPLSPIGPRFTTKRFQQLDDNCCRLKDEMSALRAIDVGLMKQFLTLYDAVEELRWMVESFDLNDSCESLSSSVSESIEQIHEKWMSERRQWQSTSSQNLASWREDSRFNISLVGRLNSTGGRRPDLTEFHSPSRPGWRSLKTASSLAMNNSFPEFSPSRRVSDFERQRRSSVDHLPLVPKTDEGSSDGGQDAPAPLDSSPFSDSPSSPIPSHRKRQKDQETSKEDGKTSPGAVHSTPVKKPKFLYHSKSSPSFKSQLQGLQVTDTADI